MGLQGWCGHHDLHRLLRRHQTSSADGPRLYRGLVEAPGSSWGYKSPLKRKPDARPPQLHCPGTRVRGATTQYLTLHHGTGCISLQALNACICNKWCQCIGCCIMQPKSMSSNACHKSWHAVGEHWNARHARKKGYGHLQSFSQSIRVHWFP